jgi:hypothetical protein
MVGLEYVEERYEIEKLFHSNVGRRNAGDYL